MTARLFDDGTMDTVIVCDCGRVHRFSWEYTDETSGMDDNDNIENTIAYENFVMDCIAEVCETCECGAK
jgi:hypothetical protein